jgi:imidazolonepropionase-like amidohydrolase
MKKQVVTAVLLLAATLTNQAAQPTEAVLVIRNVNLLAQSGGAAVQPGMSVLLRGGRIAAIGPAAEVIAPTGAVQIDGTGKFLMPGLIDLHVHLSKTRASAMNLLIAHGVTTVRDMGGDHQELLAWRRSIEGGERVGPTIVLAGPYLESVRNIERMRKDPPSLRVEPFERTRIGVGSPADARRTVAELAARDIDFIKIRTVADPDTYLALNAAANEHGIALVGHVTGIPPQRILDGGQDGIDHFIYPSLDNESERMALWKGFAARNVPIVPTIDVFLRTALLPAEQLKKIAEDDGGVVEPRRRYLSRYLALDWREQALEASDERRVAQQRIWTEVVRRDLREMHRAGMDVLVGSDTAVLNIYPGSAVHDEMELFVTELGMTPAEVLDRTTRRSAEFLRLGDSIGSIARGKVADLILLDADPTLDIRNTRRIAAVFVRGRMFDRAALDRIQADVLAAPDVRSDDWGRTARKQ